MNRVSFYSPGLDLDHCGASRDPQNPAVQKRQLRELIWERCGTEDAELLFPNITADS